MTGYGRASFENENMSIDVEIKTLNSKFLDVIVKLPKEISAHENDLKKLLSDKIGRGKINFSVELVIKNGTASAPIINKKLFSHYKSEIQNAVNGSQLNDSELVSQILRFPDILEYPAVKTEVITKEELVGVVDAALTECDKFRSQEGNAAEVALHNSSNNIEASLKSIEENDPKRIESVKRRINESLQELTLPEKTDANRFEQELIYYIEKLDITEEIVRLNNHLSYFHETLSNKESQGKKLGFISQEMGREINTIGSKANNADIQKLVVEMKDELEKIKEQVLNVV